MSANALGAERIAKIAAQHGVSQFIQVSHLDASHSSPSNFYRAKAEAEDRVKAAFPTATIVRPGPMFGYEDKLLNNMAGSCLLFCGEGCIGPDKYWLTVWPIWWKLNHSETKMRPVHVRVVMSRWTFYLLG